VHDELVQWQVSLTVFIKALRICYSILMFLVYSCIRITGLKFQVVPLHSIHVPVDLDVQFGSYSCCCE